MDSEESHLLSWDCSESKHDDVGNILTGVVVVSLADVGGDSRDIGGHLGVVHDHVGGDGLHKGGWVLDEAGEPVRDSSEVSLHVLAVAEVSWKLGEEGSDNLDSGDDGGDIALHEVLDGLVDFLLDMVGVGEASLDVLEVVLLDETEEDTGDELLSLLELRIYRSTEMA